VFRKGRGVRQVAFHSLAHSISLSVAIMEPWKLEHRMFAYDCFVRSDESVTAVQRAFRRRFNIHRNDSVPARDNLTLG
jgi:hypothetical protein